MLEKPVEDFIEPTAGLGFPPVPDSDMSAQSIGIGRRALARLDRLLAVVMDSGMVLVLPVSLLLFLQWPLRDLVQAYSRQANDLAQVLFALYVSLALSFATRQGTHLATDVLARHLPPAWRQRIARWAPLLVLMPWAVFILAASWGSVSASLKQMEGFPDTYNPGYFLIKFSVWLLAFLVLLQALIDGFAGKRDAG